jgi:uncharacterized membrane protein
MKQLLLLTFVAFFIVSVGSVNAVGLEYYGIEDSINEDLSVNNEVTLKFDSPITHLKYQLGFKVYNLTATSDFDSVDCEVREKDAGSDILCDFVGMTKKENMLKFRFITKDSVKRVDGKYQFSINYGISVPVERVTALIKLPENGVLSEEPANQSYSPEDGNILTDGKHIMVNWERMNLTSGEGLQFAVIYSMPATLSSFVIVSLTLIIIVIMIGLIMYVKRGSRKPEEIVGSVLNKNENTIINLLKKHDGKAVQKVLVRETDFSKAKVSRIVKNLKERGLVNIEPVSGRENRVILKKIEESDSGGTD